MCFCPTFHLVCLLPAFVCFLAIFGSHIFTRQSSDQYSGIYTWLFVILVTESLSWVSGLLFQSFQHAGNHPLGLPVSLWIFLVSCLVCFCCVKNCISVSTYRNYCVLFDAQAFHMLSQVINTVIGHANQNTTLFGKIMSHYNQAFNCMFQPRYEKGSIRLPSEIPFPYSLLEWKRGTTHLFHAVDRFFCANGPHLS